MTERVAEKDNKIAEQEGHEVKKIRDGMLCGRPCSETAKRDDAQEQRAETYAHCAPRTRRLRHLHEDDCVIFVNEKDIRVANSRSFQERRILASIDGTFLL
jgi:hypothetical protein